MTPKVSVIVPNYNHAPYLRQRLDSIFNQTFQNFEVIILDDRSTDNSKEIIEEYRNQPQISHLVYNDINSGSPFRQWGKGFNLAQGEYIWIAESDDWAEATFLEVLVPILDENKNLTIAYSNSDHFSISDHQNSNVFPKDTLINGLTFFNNHMLTRNSICNASCTLFRRASSLGIPPDYQSFGSCGDWLFWIELCQKGDVFYTSKVLNHFRQHEESTTKKSIRSGTAYQEYLKIFQKLKKKGMISFSKQQRIAVFFITHTPAALPANISGAHYYDSTRNEWKRETFNPTLSRLYVDCCYIFWFIKKCIYSLFGKKISPFF